MNSEKVVKHKPLESPERLLEMSAVIQRNADQFRRSLRTDDDKAWREGAFEQICQRLTEIAERFPTLELKHAFAYRAAVRTAAEYMRDNMQNINIRPAFARVIDEQCAHGQTYAVKFSAGRTMVSRVRERINQFQLILADANQIFHNVSSIVERETGSDVQPGSILGF